MTMSLRTTVLFQLVLLAQWGIETTIRFGFTAYFVSVTTWCSVLSPWKSEKISVCLTYIRMFVQHNYWKGFVGILSETDGTINTNQCPFCIQHCLSNMEYSNEHKFSKFAADVLQTRHPYFDMLCYLPTGELCKGR